MSRIVFRSIWFFAALCFASAGTWAPTAHGDEADSKEELIVDFRSVIQVETGGRLTVTETITVIADGNHIKRGIYRDLPTSIASPGNRRRALEITVLDVTRNGSVERHRVVRSDEDVTRILIGSADRSISPGRHIYRLRYRTNAQLLAGGDSTMLTWPINGNRWSLPIDSLSSEVHLPPAALPTRTTLVVHEDGVVRPFIAHVETKPGRISIEVKRRIPIASGLVLHAVFPTSALGDHVSNASWQDIVFDIRVLIAIAAQVVVIGFYGIAWYRYGRLTKPGLIQPSANPPDGISPAAARFIRSMRYDPRCFVSALINLAIKKHITIERSGPEQFEITSRDRGHPSLFSGEWAIINSLFRTDRTVRVGVSRHADIRKAVADHLQALGSEFEQTSFRRNRHILGIGIGLSLLALLCLVVALDSNGGMTWFGFAFTGAVVLGVIVHQGVDAARRKDHDRVLARILVGSAIIAGIILCLIQIHWIFAPVVIAHVFLAAFVIRRFRSHTVLGRGVLDALEGLRLFVETKETERFRLADRTPITPRMFNMLLPYATALGVETEWAERVAQSSEFDSKGRELWAVTSLFPVMTPDTFADDLVDSLAVAVWRSALALEGERYLKGEMRFAEVDVTASDEWEAGQYHGRGGRIWRRGSFGGSTGFGSSGGGFGGGGFSGGGGGSGRGGGGSGGGDGW